MMHARTMRPAEIAAEGKARHAVEFGEAYVIGAYKDFIARAAKEYR